MKIYDLAKTQAAYAERNLPSTLRDTMTQPFYELKEFTALADILNFSITVFSYRNSCVTRKPLIYVIVTHAVEGIITNQLVKGINEPHTFGCNSNKSSIHPALV